LKWNYAVASAAAAAGDDIAPVLWVNIAVEIVPKINEIDDE
jgi:hypothetical protein